MKLIKKVQNYIPASLDNKEIVFYEKIDNDELLSKIGFSIPFVNNEGIIPNPVNKANSINVYGKTIIRKDLPKEDFYIYLSHEAPNFGDYSRGTHTVDATIKRQRYIRENTTPYCLKFILIIKDDSKYVYSELIRYDLMDLENAALLFNMFRMTFGSVPQIAQNYSDPIVVVKRFEWEFIGSGTRDEIIEHVKSKLGLTNTEKIMFRERIDYLIQYSEKNEILVGKNSFEGYFLIESPKHYIFESLFSNNATYLVKKELDWQQISKLNKLEIIRLAIAQRFYHTSNWESNIALQL